MVKHTKMSNNELSKLSKCQVRYWCFRFKTEEEGGAKADGAPIGLKEHFESMEWFSSWGNFTVTWDVVDSVPLQMRRLKESSEEEWNKVLAANARDLPSVEK